ncbi:hypothetical protein [Rhodanobacter sp. DHG33]|uniref:hypothetical protein n=1 Tax=Rhodanobacter sp. DHG33 TaxID=2775921 RepID=UPI0017856E3C|nr:hypothetical protein [Rhodanobacter sp. DHG33]MBD8898933.1 hypothetical protein [Rhodanobacter sp. DHG33]
MQKAVCERAEKIGEAAGGESRHKIFATRIAIEAAMRIDVHEAKVSVAAGLGTVFPVFAAYVHGLPFSRSTLPDTHRAMPVRRIGRAIRAI